jgi:hypothetical protein
MTHSEIKQRLMENASSAERFFEMCGASLGALIEQSGWGGRTKQFWNSLPDEIKVEGEKVTEMLLDLARDLAALCKRSLLTTDADINDVHMSVKKMRAALHLREFYYWDPEVLHDEGMVLGFKQSSQQEGDPLTPKSAHDQYQKAIRQLYKVLQLCDTGKSDDGRKAIQGEANKYRPNSAFIMMWMEKRESSLSDVLDAVKEIFAEFGISAIRADDIEHEGVITNRVLEEIRTSEFLFADLTGVRPNVYYEVGYAHALGKRVILFRRNDTQIHFDLVGYNCPEYENLGDLKAKLRKRLSVITNTTDGRSSLEDLGSR